jgi:hypothetical protein
MSKAKEKETRKESVIMHLVDLAVDLANTFLDSGNTERALGDLLLKVIEAHEEFTGEPVDLARIRYQASL